MQPARTNRRFSSRVGSEAIFGMSKYQIVQVATGVLEAWSVVAINAEGTR
jgi:hypothetical protein